MALTLRTIAAQDTLSLRQAILWPNQPLSHVQLPKDDTALHIGAFDGPDPVGVASFFPNQATAQLRKLAVTSEYRGAGLGTRLVLCGAKHLATQGITELWCDARQDALPFYQNLGFQIDAKVFIKTGRPYQRALLSLVDIL